MIYLVGFICFYAGYCLGVYLMRKVLNDYKEIHRLEAEQNKVKDLHKFGVNSMFLDGLKKNDPHVIKTLEYGAKIIIEMEQDVKENTV